MSGENILRLVRYLDGLYKRFTSDDHKFDKEEEKVNCPLEIYFPHNDLTILWLNVKARKYTIHFFRETKCVFLYLLHKGDETLIKSWSYREELMKEVLERIKQNYNTTHFCITCNRYQSNCHWIDDKCMSEIIHEYVLENDPCPICLGGASDYVSKCNHSFHRKCIYKTMEARKETCNEEEEDVFCHVPCPICRKRIHLE